MSKTTFTKRLIFRFCIALLTFLIGIGAFVGWEQFKGASFAGDELTLRLASDTPVLRVDEYPTVKLYVTNNGEDTVTLVQPGDGSTNGWRTPVVKWAILENGQWVQHPEGFELIRCGNINSLKWDEVFRLAPGETREMKVWLPVFRKPGAYRIKFFYTNQPWKKWSGIELGTHNPIAMWRVKHSTECSLISNEVVFTVNE